MAKTWGSPKDPQAIRDYGYDWGPDIGAVTIVSSVWTSPDPALVVVSDTHDDTTVTARLSGGVASAKYGMLNHIVMSDGEEDEVTITLTVKDL